MDTRQLLQDVSSTYDLNKEAFRGTLLSTRQSVEALDQDYALTEVQRTFQVPAESMVQVVYPLSDPVQVLLGQAVQDSPRVRSGSFEPDCVGSLNKLVAEGPELWTLGSLSVLQVSPEVVLKGGLDLDVDYLADLQHVKQQAPSVPLPRILGALRADKLTYIFMTYIPGQPLDKVWPQLGKDQKLHVQRQLESMFSAIRSVSHPAKEDDKILLGTGRERRCKDMRRNVRVAQHPMSTEDELNDFLLPPSEDAGENEYRDMVHSYMFANHDMVFTHGDLHPRNVMVLTYDVKKVRSDFFELYTNR